jgi:hypothetical protein
MKAVPPDGPESIELKKRPRASRISLDNKSTSLDLSICDSTFVWGNTHAARKEGVVLPNPELVIAELWQRLGQSGQIVISPDEICQLP